MSIENASARISVIVITHNNARHVERCLESMLSQTLRPFEIIVCDDASTDDTCAILDAWAARYPDIIRLVKHSINQGIPANLNSGFRVARGDYISLIAGDDIWLPEKLEKEYLRLRDTGAAWAYSKVVLYWDDLDNPSQTAEFWGTAPGFEGNVFEKVLRREMSLRNYLVRRDAMAALGFFDESIGMYEDWDFNIRMSHAYPIAHVAEPNVVYLIHSGGEHHAPMYRHMAEVNKILRKNASLLPGKMAEIGRETIRRFWPESSMPTDRDKAAYRTALDSLDLPWLPARVRPDGEGLIFLVSLPRSGSTMLQRILGGHPDIHTTAEPWLMLNPLYQLKESGVTAEYNAQLGRQAVGEFLEQLPRGEENYHDAVRQMASVLYSRAVRFSGKSRFLDKTPRYYRIIPELLRTFPKARVVVLLRNPLAVFASMLDTWFDGDVKRLEDSDHFGDLMEGPALLARALEEFGDRIHVTRYEQLVSEDGWQEVQRLCEYIGVPPYRPMLDYGDTPAPQGNFGDKRRVHRHRSPVAHYVDKWVETIDRLGLGEYAQKYTEALGANVLARLGYPLDARIQLVAKGGGAKDVADISLNVLGEKAFAEGDLARAEQLFHQARERDGADIDARNNLMVLNWQRGDMDQAVRFLLEALEIDPVNRDVVFNGIQVLAAIGQPVEALALGRRYLAQYPDDNEISGLCSEAGALAEEPCEETVSGRGKDDTGGMQGDGQGAPPKTDEGSVEITDFSQPGLAETAPRISIVVPSFNQGEFLEQTLRSIVEQGYPNLELIVMDGGSTDGSVDIIKKYANYISWWTSEPDDGQYWAVNEGFKRCSGEIMCWLNSDDVLLPGSLNTVASVFTQRPDLEWVTGTPNVMDENGTLTWVCHPPPVFSQQKYLDKEYGDPVYIQQEGTFWRRSLWEKAGARLETRLEMAGDLELWMRFFRHAPLQTLNVHTGRFRQYGRQKTGRAMEVYHREAEDVLEAESRRFAAEGGTPIPPLPVLEVRAPLPGAGAGRMSGVPGQAVSAMPHMSRAPAAGQKQASQAQIPPGPRPESEEYTVTAIVSTYNSEKFIRGCLEDLEAQTIADRLEIIVVDSGSREGERAIVEEFQQRFGNIVYLRTEQRETIYAAWNRAARVARGRYLTNANTDDRHRSDAFERMAEKLDSRPDVALVYADSAVTWEENADFSTAPVQSCFRWPDFDPRLLFSTCYIGPQPMWRKSVHERHGYFDDAMTVAGDYDFWLRMAPHETFLHIPEILGLYLASSGSLEHRFARQGAEESALARARNWPADWGEIPHPGPGYLVPLEEPLQRQESAPAVHEAGKTPLVSIVMPTRNRLHLIGRAIDSVIAQKFTDWELIVVNDGGESVQPLLKDRDAGGRIRCIEFGWSRGQAAARNTALSEARGEFICYLDDDDTYLPNHLQTVVNALQDRGCDFVYTDAVIVKEGEKNGVLCEQERAMPYRHEEYSHERLLVSNYIPINTWAHRRSLLDEAGMFDVSLQCYEDWELLLRFASRQTFRHVRETTVEVHHRVDRVDNVSRLQHGRTVAAYREIYARHGGTGPGMEEQRRKVLEHLEKSIAEAGVTDEGDVVNPGSVATAPAAESSPVGAENPVPSRPETLYESWLRMRRESVGSREDALQRMDTEWTSRPSVHFVMTVLPGQEAALADTLDGLSAQWYPGWGLSVVSTLPCPDPLFEQLDNLEWCQVQDEPDTLLPGVLEQSGADWLVRVDPGTVPEPHFLFVCLDEIQTRDRVRVVYVDDDRCDSQGGYYQPRFKPDFNLELLRATPYLGPVLMIRRDALPDVLAAFDNETAGWDIAFRIVERHGHDAFCHVPHILIHRSVDVAAGVAEDELARRRLACLQGHLERSGVRAVVNMDDAVPGSFRVEYSCERSAPVEILVPVSGRADLLGLFLDKLFEKTDYPDFRVRLVLGHGVDVGQALEGRETIECVSCGRGKTLWRCVLETARGSSADHVLFMNPSVLAIQAGWLNRMMGVMQRQDVHAVAPRLISADGKVVDGPIVLGAGSCSAGAIVHSGLALDDPGDMGRARLAQEVSAVSANCMLVRRSALEAMEDLRDRYRIPLYQAIDICLGIRAQGGRIVSLPQVTLLHSGQQDGVLDGIDIDNAVRRESMDLCQRVVAMGASDAAYNPNLKLVENFFSVDDELVTPWSRYAPRLPRCVGFGVGTYGAWEYRLKQPLAAMHDKGVSSSLILPYQRSIVRLPTVAELARMEPDVILMHNAIHDEYIEAMETWARAGGVDIVFGQDDLMFALPPKNPFSKTVYKDARKRIRRCLDFSDRVIVSTEPLADALRGMAADIRVVPNHLDETIWGKLRATREPGERPRVGWAGATQHEGDLALLEEVVRETCDQVDWVFFGMCPDFLRPYVKEFHEPVGFQAYPGKLAELNLDVAVAPLEINRFNECKSNLRLLEYGALGWAVVASDIAPYRNAPVCRVHNQPRAWIKAILERAHDRDAARREGERLREWVRANGFLRDHLSLWLEALTGVDAVPERRSLGNISA